MKPGATVESIHIAPAAAAPMEPLERATLRAGVGISGDRYARDDGAWSDHPAGDHELTLVAAEVIEELGLEAGSSRRNVTTRGVDLDSLIGRDFTIGAVLCHGIRRCEPCTQLQKQIGRPILRQMAHRGGLRASILGDGEISVGDPVTAA